MTFFRIANLCTAITAIVFLCLYHNYFMAYGLAMATIGEVTVWYQNRVESTLLHEWKKAFAEWKETGK